MDSFSMGDVDFRSFDNRCHLTDYLGPQFADPVLDRINYDNRVILWGIRSWCMVSGRDKHCVPHIWKKLVLLAPESGTTKIDNNDALETWCALAQKTHHEQLNLCKFYEQAGELYLVAGLTAHTTLSAGQAEVVAFSVWETMRQGQLPLPQAYQALWANVKSLSASEGYSRAKRECGTSARHTQTEPTCDADSRNDTCDTGMTDPREADLCNKPIKLRLAGCWSKVLELGTDTSSYYQQLKKCSHLHDWCNTKWGDTHMQWDDFNKYVDSSLSTRVRLIYWLRRIWYTYYPEWGIHLPSSYDALLRRYVRDFAQSDRWVADGDASRSIEKWRALAPIFHQDQLDLCPFYCKVDPSFMQKGLQADNHITSSDAANLLSLSCHRGR
jgi:hypothetical protein